MAEVVLDELKRHPRIEEMGGNRVPKAVAGVVLRQPSLIAVPDEEGLDLALLKGSAPPDEERAFRHLGSAGEVTAENFSR
jgi:hypothetical protein